VRSTKNRRHCYGKSTFVTGYCVIPFNTKDLNTHLDLHRNKVFEYQKDLLLEGLPITLENFKMKWVGVAQKPRMLMEIFQEHNDQMKQLIGKEFSDSTAQRYRVSFQHTRNFLLWKFGKEVSAILLRLRQSIVQENIVTKN
jgi:hypothetical protein